MEINKKLLRSKMALHDDNITTLAKYIGLGRVALSMRINGKLAFNSQEIAMISKRYDLTNDELVEIFGLNYGCD